MRPVITVEQGNIPLYGGGKIRIHSSLHAAQTGIHHMQIDRRNCREAAEYRRHVLYWVGRHRKHAQSPVAHAGLAEARRKSRTPAGSAERGTKKLYMYRLYKEIPRESIPGFAVSGA